jgi:hypothetical protein
MEWSDVIKRFDFIAMIDAAAIHRAELLVNSNAAAIHQGSLLVVDSVDGNVRLYSCTTCFAVITEERLVQHVKWWHDATS